MARKRKSQPNHESLFKGKTPHMPEGYYSGDKPNPNLGAFVEQHIKEQPYDAETDDCDTPAFDRALHVANRRSAVNDLHIYWSKKPHDAVQQYVDHYTQPGDLVLDPFAGAGGTALCALRRGCSAIAIDRSPAASFITRYYCTPVDLQQFQEAFEEVMEAIRPTFEWLYEARTPSNGRAQVRLYGVVPGVPL